MKSAILATDSTIVHYVRLLVVLTQGTSIKVRVFQNREEAAQWLGVPVELLATEPRATETPQENFTLNTNKNINQQINYEYC